MTWCGAACRGDAAWRGAAAWRCGGVAQVSLAKFYGELLLVSFLGKHFTEVCS